MRILILADRRIGHLRQARGLAGLIAMERGGETVELAVDARPWAPERLRQAVSWMRWIPPFPLLSRVYGFSKAAVSGFDLVIGSGRPTILAGCLIARASGARFLYCGRASGYCRTDITRLLVPYRAAADGAKQVFAPIPSPVNPLIYPAPRRLFGVNDLRGAEIALLVGGPSSGRGWSLAEWGELAAFVLATAEAFGVVWSIATSRRTPELATNLLAAAFGVLETKGRFVDFRTAGPNSADGLLGADAICVTSDSTSMITEGLAARRPVLAIGSTRLKPTRDDGLLADWSRQGSFAEVALAGLQPADWAAAVLRLEPPTIDLRRKVLDAVVPVLDEVAGR